MSAAPSAAGALLFFALRSAENAARRRLRRLTEARYALGLAIAVAYIAFVLVRPGRPGLRGAAAAAPLPVAWTTVGLLAASGALLLGAALVWLFRGSEASLSLTEGEAEFLFAAPIPRSAVVHFALLRSQLRVLLGVLAALLFSRPSSAAGLLRSALGAWILFSTVNLHVLGVGFTKAAWKERSPLRRRTTALLATLLALALLGFAAAALAEIAVRVARSPRSPGVLSVEAAVATGVLGRPLLALLLPLRAVVAPLFAPTAAAFAAALPASLLVLALHYVWVVRTNVRYEDATIAGAARRAAERARRRGELPALPGEAKRRSVPFRLEPAGRPETAIVWKNLAAWSRTPLATRLGGVVALGPLAFAAGAFLSSPAGDQATAVALLVLSTLTPLLALLLPSGLRLDLRRDLADAALLRSWPVRPAGLVAAELAAPFSIGLLVLVGGALATVGLSAGRALRGATALSGALGGIGAPDRLFPAVLTAFLVIPPLSLLFLLGQNGATLAFPAWFPPGPQRSRGLEQMGINLLTFAASFVALALAVVPAAVLALPVLYLGRGLPGAWSFPLAALLGSLPLWGEAAFGVLLMARMWERFDPSVDLPD